MSSIERLRKLRWEDQKAIMEWVNSEVTSETGEKQLTDMIMKLQFVSQDIDRGMGRLCEELTRTSPALFEVMNNVQRSSIELVGEVRSLMGDMSRVSEKYTSALGSVSEIHSVQSAMHECVESLSEYHNWETKIAQIKRMFESPIEAAMSKLSTAKRPSRLSSARSPSDGCPTSVALSERERELRRDETYLEIARELTVMNERVSILRDTMSQTVFEERSREVVQMMSDLELAVEPRLIHCVDARDDRGYRRCKAVLLAIGRDEDRDIIDALYLRTRLDACRQLTVHFSHGTISASKMGSPLRAFSQKQKKSAKSSKKVDYAKSHSSVEDNIGDALLLTVSESEYLSGSETERSGGRDSLNEAERRRRVGVLHEWLSDLLHSILQIVEDECDWAPLIITPKSRCLSVCATLVERVFEELTVDVKEWLSIFLGSLSDASTAADTGMSARMNKLMALFDCLSVFHAKVCHSKLESKKRVLSPASGLRAVISGSSDEKSEGDSALRRGSPLALRFRVEAMIKTLLFDFYKRDYLRWEKSLLFASVFESVVFGKAVDLGDGSDSDSRLPQHELLSVMASKLSSLEGLCLAQFVESYKRCLLLTHGALVKEYAAIADEFMNKCLATLESLLDSLTASSITASASQRPAVGVSEDVGSEETDEWSSDLKLCMDLRKTVKTVNNSFRNAVNDCTLIFIDGITALNDESHESTSVAFHRVFLSVSELQLLSKFSNAETTRDLFVKSGELLAAETDSAEMAKAATQRRIVSGGGRLNSKMDSVTLRVLMAPILATLSGAHKLAVWTTARTRKARALDLPEFAATVSELAKDVCTHWMAISQHLDNAFCEESEEHQIDKWLTLVVNETVDALFAEMYQLSALTAKGKEQLNADLAHISATANRMFGINCAFLGAMLKILSCESADALTLRKELLDESAEEGSAKLVTSFHRKVATKVAVFIGLGVRFNT